jgi:hypothetical protein
MHPRRRRCAHASQKAIRPRWHPRDASRCANDAAQWELTCDHRDRDTFDCRPVDRHLLQERVMSASYHHDCYVASHDDGGVVETATEYLVHDERL